MQIVSVRLIDEWLSHKPSTILHLSPFKAQELVARKIAVFIEDEVEQQEQIEQKDITAPPRDKQVKKAWRKEV